LDFIGGSLTQQTESEKPIRFEDALERLTYVYFEDEPGRLAKKSRRVALGVFH